MQFCFMSGCETTDVTFILGQLEKKHLGKKDLYFKFVDLQNAFEHIPREFVRWTLRHLYVDQWLVKFVQSRYRNARTQVRLNGSFSIGFPPR